MSSILGNLSKILALDVSFAENSFPQTLQTKLVFIFVKFGVICSCLGDWLSCTGCFIIGSIWFRNHGKSFTKWDPKRCSCSSFILAKKTQCAWSSSKWTPPVLEPFPESISGAWDADAGLHMGMGAKPGSREVCGRARHWCSLAKTSLQLQLTQPPSVPNSNLWNSPPHLKANSHYNLGTWPVPTPFASPQSPSHYQIRKDHFTLLCMSIWVQFFCILSFF